MTIKLISQALSYYTTLFNGQTGGDFPPVQPRKLVNDEGKRHLSSAVDISEIHKAVFSIDDSNGPELDGFTLFSSMGSYPIGWITISSPLSLKKIKPRFISDYRLISYDNVLYKICSEIIYSRIIHLPPFLIAKINLPLFLTKIFVKILLAPNLFVTSRSKESQSCALRLICKRPTIW